MEPVAKLHDSEKSRLFDSIARTGEACPEHTDGGLPRGVGEEVWSQWGQKERFCASKSLAIGSIVSGAQSSLSLAELIDTALKNNPETEKAWANVKRAQAALGVAKSSNYPSVDATGTSMHGREVKFPNGPNTIYTNYGGELSLSYLLLDCGERNAAIEAMKEALKAARWESDFAIQRVIYKVCAHYYEYLHADELLKMKESTLIDFKTMFEAADELYKAGLRCMTDLNMSKAEVAQAHMDVAQEKARVAIAYGKLLTSLGLPIEMVIHVQTNPDGMKTSLFSEGTSKLIAMAEGQRADLLAKKAALSEMKQRVKRASRAPLPKLRAVGQGGWLEYTKHQGSGYNYNVGLALDIPIFKGFEYSYNKRLALANQEITAAELRDLREAIAQEVLTYSELVKAAEESLKWSSEYMSEACKSFDGTLESYKAGLQNVFDLIQSQRSLADARIKKAQARTQWLVSLAELAFATGSITK